MAACRSLAARQGKWSARAASGPRLSLYDRSNHFPEIDFSVVCSKGFYVRTYVHDIGEVLGCGAHLKSLRRTKSGRFDVAQAISVDHIKNASREEILSRLLTLPEVSRMRGA
jgi:tRNA pseudouridine55 synthase